MEIDESIEEIVNGLSVTSQQEKDWQELKNLFKKMDAWGECYSQSVDFFEAKNILDVLKKLRDNFYYTDLIEDENASGGEKGQFSNIIKLSRLDGDVLDMLDTLSGIWRIRAWGTPKEHLTGRGVHYFLSEEDIDSFKALLKDKLYKRYEKIYWLLQEELGYELKQNYARVHQQSLVVNLSQIEGDVYGAIYALANKGLRIHSPRMLSQKDVDGVERIIKTFEDKGLDLTITVAGELFIKGDETRFKNYFSILDKDDQQKIIEELFNSKDNNNIQNWLLEEYGTLVKETAYF